MKRMEQISSDFPQVEDFEGACRGLMLLHVISLAVCVVFNPVTNLMNANDRNLRL